MKGWIFLSALLISNLAMATDLSQKKQVEAQSQYDNPETAIKDNRLQIEHQCFNSLKGEKLVYLHDKITVFPPPASHPASHPGFGNTYNVVTTGDCILRN